MIEDTPLCVADKGQLAALAEHFSLELTRQDTSDGPKTASSERQQGTKNLFRTVREYLKNFGINASLSAVSFDKESHLLAFHFSDGSCMKFMVCIEVRECIYILERIDGVLRIVYVPRLAPTIPDEQ